MEGNVESQADAAITTKYPFQLKGKIKLWNHGLKCVAVLYQPHIKMYV